MTVVCAGNSASRGFLHLAQLGHNMRSMRSARASIVSRAFSPSLGEIFTQQQLGLAQHPRQRIIDFVTHAGYEVGHLIHFGFVICGQRAQLFWRFVFS